MNDEIQPPSTAQPKRWWFEPTTAVLMACSSLATAREEAKKAREQSNAAGGYASSYLGNTVILASVLFFAGMAGKFDQRHVRQSSLAFGIAMFLYAVFRIILLPVSF